MRRFPPHFCAACSCWRRTVCCCARRGVGGAATSDYETARSSMRDKRVRAAVSLSDIQGVALPEKMEPKEYSF